MNTLINPSTISSKQVDEVYNQVIDALESLGVVTAKNADEVVSYFSQIEDETSSHDIHENIVQSFDLDGELNGDWQSTIHVDIQEYYIDSGSDDYVYTVRVRED